MDTLENTGKQAITVEYTDVHTETTDATTPVIVTPLKLTTRQENFARLYAETGVAQDSYAAAYDCEGSSRATIRVNAFRLLRSPKVAQRVRELQDATAERSLRSTAALVRELEEMVNVDPNELVRLDVGSCRHCWGIGGAYQHRDQAEFAMALAQAIDSKGAIQLPTDTGGYGYTHDREANPDCAKCEGAGVPRVKYTSTADVSPGARRLLRGIELFPDGSVKRVLLHDQTQLRIELHKLRGLHIDRSVNVNVDATPALKDMSRDQQLEFLASLAPTAS
jgi:Terminase small subunit